jgi:PTS system arbutin-like IIC component
MATVMYICGVVGNIGGGLLDQFLPQNWIPMFHNHASMMFIQIGIGVCFTAIYFVVFKTLILRLNLKTPGREESEIKLYSKADYQAARGQTTAAARGTSSGQAAGFLQALGGAAISKASTTAPPDFASRWSIWRKPKATTSLKRWAPTGGATRQRHSGHCRPARSPGARPAGIADEKFSTTEQTTMTEAVS